LIYPLVIGPKMPVPCVNQGLSIWSAWAS
jgi:hypothetical protein